MATLMALLARVRSERPATLELLDKLDEVVGKPSDVDAPNLLLIFRYFLYVRVRLVLVHPFQLTHLRNGRLVTELVFPNNPLSKRERYDRRRDVTLYNFARIGRQHVSYMRDFLCQACNRSHRAQLSHIEGRGTH